LRITVSSGASGPTSVAVRVRSIASNVARRVVPAGIDARGIPRRECLKKRAADAASAPGPVLPEASAAIPVSCNGAARMGVSSVASVPVGPAASTATRAIGPLQPIPTSASRASARMRGLLGILARAAPQHLADHGASGHLGRGARAVDRSNGA
jgi:hypothetical protein